MRRNATSIEQDVAAAKQAAAQAKREAQQQAAAQAAKAAAKRQAQEQAAAESEAGLNVAEGRPGVFLIPNEGPLDLTEVISAK